MATYPMTRYSGIQKVVSFYLARVWNMMSTNTHWFVA